MKIGSAVAEPIFLIFFSVMTIGAILGVIAVCSPSAICLIFAWLRSKDSLEDASVQSWRATIAAAGLVLASVSQLLITAFLASGYHSQGQSFAQPAPRAWIVSNSMSVVAWAAVLLAAFLGTGKTKQALLYWAILMPLESGLIIMSGSTF